MSGEVGEKSNLLEIGGLKNGKILPFGALRGPPFRVPKKFCARQGRKTKGLPQALSKPRRLSWALKGPLRRSKVGDFLP